MVVADPIAAVRKSPDAGRSEILLAAVPFLIVGCAFVVRLLVGPLTIDDAYITFRYARNLATGLGFVYNPGEHVIGTTTPLYTMLLAALYLAGLHDLPRVALVVNAAADAATTAILYVFASRLGFGRWAAYLAALFALCSGSIAFAASGMETSVFVLFVVGALVAVGLERPGLAGALAGLATLTRPDGLLVVALVLGRYVVARRLPPARAIVGVVVPLLPWLVFATWWSGSPVPQSMVAKATMEASSPVRNLTWFLLQVCQPGFNPLGIHLPRGSAFTTLLAVMMANVITLLALRWRQARRHLAAHVGLLPFALFAPLLMTGYVLAGFRDVRLFDWYLVPLVPFYLFALVASIRGLSPATRLAAVALVTAWTLYGLVDGRADNFPLGMDLIRENTYAATAAALAPRLTPNSVVALPEIGAFGYATDARILDTEGLVSPRATRVGSAGGNLADLVEQTRPDFIVGLDCMLDPALESPRISSQYRLLWQTSTPIWTCHAMRTYERISDSPGSR